MYLVFIKSNLKELAKGFSLKRVRFPSSLMKQMKLKEYFETQEETYKKIEDEGNINGAGNNIGIGEGLSLFKDKLKVAKDNSEAHTNSLVESFTKNSNIDDNLDIEDGVPFSIVKSLLITAHNWEILSDTYLNKCTEFKKLEEKLTSEVDRLNMTLEAQKKEWSFHCEKTTAVLTSDMLERERIIQDLEVAIVEYESNSRELKNQLIQKDSLIKELKWIAWKNQLIGIGGLTTVCGLLFVVSKTGVLQKVVNVAQLNNGAGSKLPETPVVKPIGSNNCCYSENLIHKFLEIYYK